MDMVFKVKLSLSLNRFREIIIRKGEKK